MIKLREYQEEAADFLFEHDRAMILAPVGAGKTAITLTAMRDMIKRGVVKQFLVLAPKRVCETVWPVEIKKFAPELSIAVAVGPPAKRDKALGSGADIITLNYENIPWLVTKDTKFDGVVFDELTKLKSTSGMRFKLLYKYIKNVNVRWGLTGSFTSNGLEDVYGQCKIVSDSILPKSKTAFMQQYFTLINRDFGQWAPLQGSLTAVMNAIKPYTYVLDAGEYADKLPDLNIVELDCPMKDMAMYKKMKRELAISIEGQQVSAVNAGVLTGKLQQMASGFIYNTITTPNPDRPGKFDSDTTIVSFSDHKLLALDELMQENQGANTIIVYQFKHELEELLKRYPKSLTLDHDNAVDRWNSGKEPILLLHPKSAGHGLNLQQGGHHMVFMSLPWSLELFEQTVGRLRRGGQTKPVWVYIMQTPDTIDQSIYAALKDKRDVSSLALDELR